MSKNIKLNNTNYNGVSTVQLPTTDGRSASFKDVDEITTPSGTKTITENGTYDVTNFAQAIVNVVSSGNSNGDMESGTFIGNGTNSCAIPVTSKKSHLIVWGGTGKVEDYESTKFSFTGLSAVENWGCIISYVNYNASGFDGKFASHEVFGTQGQTDVSFTESEITVVAFAGGASNVMPSSVTYNWVAW